MYLTEDIIGACSKIVYGLKGDRVEVIRQGWEMHFVSNRNERFYVRKEKLSEEKVTANVIENRAVTVQRTRSVKRRK